MANFLIALFVLIFALLAAALMAFVLEHNVEASMRVRITRKRRVYHKEGAAPGEEIFKKREISGPKKEPEDQTLIPSA